MILLLFFVHVGGFSAFMVLVGGMPFFSRDGWSLVQAKRERDGKKLS